MEGGCGGCAPDGRSGFGLVSFGFVLGDWSRWIIYVLTRGGEDERGHGQGRVCTNGTDGRITPGWACVVVWISHLAKEEEEKEWMAC